jgi:hypothetical protein
MQKSNFASKVEDYDEKDDCLPTYAAHWPKKPHMLPLPKHDMSLISPPAYSISLKDFDCDELILHRIHVPPI